MNIFGKNRVILLHFANRKGELLAKARVIF